MWSPLPSIPYSQSREGFWDPVTATINWCEEDYYATRYVAEIMNTITNFIFVYLSYKGVRSCLQHGHDAGFLAAFLSYFFIGVGSICFHASLKYSMQLLDELSMIYMACTAFYAMYSFDQTRTVRLFIFIFITSVAGFITGYYHYLKDPAFHQNMFALLAAVVIFKVIYEMEILLRPSRQANPRKSQNNGSTAVSMNDREQARIGKRDAAILNQMWRMAACGIVSLGLGFLIWNLDNIYCDVLRSWRRQVGLPWGIVLEGHGWWHLFTGLAAYYILTWGVWLRYCQRHQQDDVILIWPSLFTSVPVVVKKHSLLDKESTKLK